MTIPETSHLAEGLSTAMRKGIDTKLSVILFNALHGMHEDDWGAFVTHVSAGLARRGRHDAGSLRDACLDYAGDWSVLDAPRDGRRRGPRQDALLRIWRTGLSMMTQREWLDVTRFIRSGVAGDHVTLEADELSLLPVGPDDNEVTVVVERGGVEVARLRRRSVVEAREGDFVRVTRNDADVLGGKADKGKVGQDLGTAVDALTYAANTARAQAVLARLDVDRVRSLADAPMGGDLTPDVPSDAALTAHGVTGAVLYRKPTRDDDGNTAVEYLVLAPADDGLRLRTWTVRHGRSPVPGSETMHARAMAKLSEKGRCRMGTGIDCDRTSAVTEVRQEDGMVAWDTTIGYSGRHPAFSDLEEGVLATGSGTMPGTLAGLGTPEPKP